jgi:hypothetical protein
MLKIFAMSARGTTTVRLHIPRFLNAKRIRRCNLSRTFLISALRSNALNRRIAPRA